MSTLGLEPLCGNMILAKPGIVDSVVWSVVEYYLAFAIQCIGEFAKLPFRIARLGNWHVGRWQLADKEVQKLCLVNVKQNSIHGSWKVDFQRD